MGHQIDITYCVPWDYSDRAVGAARDLMTNYQHVIDELRFVMGDRGVFDVVVDGATIYSKAETGRHAHDGEVLELFTELVGPDVVRFGA